MNDRPVLKVQNLTTRFHSSYGIFTAVDVVSFDVAKGEVLGLVGESGSGKSVTFNSVMGLVPAPGRIDAGELIFDGRNLRTLSNAQMRDVRGQEIALTLPAALPALTTDLTVGEDVDEAPM